MIQRTMLFVALLTALFVAAPAASQAAIKPATLPTQFYTDHAEDVSISLQASFIGFKRGTSCVRLGRTAAMCNPWTMFMVFPRTTPKCTTNACHSRPQPQHIKAELWKASRFVLYGMLGSKPRIVKWGRLVVKPVFKK